MVRRPVGAHEAAAVDRKEHGEVLKRHVVNHLIDRTLQETRIDGEDRSDRRRRQPGRIGDGVLLRNRHVAVAGRKALREFDEPRTLAHGGSDPVEHRILFGAVANPPSEDLRVGGLGRFRARQNADVGIELADAVIGRRIGFRGGIALSLLRHDVQDTGTVELAKVSEHFEKFGEAVAVHRSEVVEVVRREDARRRRNEVDRLLFHAFGDFPEAGNGLEDLLAQFARVHEGARRDNLRQMRGKCAHGRRNRAVVVVQDDEKLQALLVDPRVVERLERHAAGKRPVADHGDVPAVFDSEKRVRHRHPESGRNRGRRVRSPEGVVLAFATLWKAGNPVVLTQRPHAVATSGEHFVGVGLVTHVPDDLVVRRVEDGVKRNRKLHGAQGAREVPARLRDGPHHEVADFLRKNREASVTQDPYVFRRINAVQNRRVRFFHAFSSE